MFSRETTAKITRGSRVGYSISANCVKIHLIVSQPLYSEILSLGLTKSVLLQDCSEALLSDVASFLEQSNLLVVAEGLANKIIDIPDYGVTSKPIFTRPVIPTEKYLEGHWW